MLREYIKCVLPPLTEVVDPIINLISRFYNFCERREYAFNVLPEYSIIIRRYSPCVRFQLLVYVPLSHIEQFYEASFSKYISHHMLLEKDFMKLFHDFKAFLHCIDKLGLKFNLDNYYSISC